MEDPVTASKVIQQDGVYGMNHERPSSNPDDDRVGEVISWLAALKVAGVLVASGFIARYAREQFLGVSLGDWNTTTLCLFAGRCAVDSILLPLEFICSHLIWSVALILIFIILVLGIRRYRPPVLQEEILRSTASGILLLTLVFIFLYFEAPTISLRDWLIGTPPLQPITDVDTPLRSRYADICKLLLTSRLPANGNPGASIPILSGFSMTRTQAQKTIDHSYAFCVLICSAAWIYIWIDQRSGAKMSRLRWRGTLSLVLVISTLMVTVFIPYMYGKMIDATSFPTVDLSYLEAPPQCDRATVHSVEMPLVYENDKVVSVVSIENGVSRIIEVPRERLLYLHLYDRQDALSTLLEQRTLPDNNPEAP
jgi:hypothetical protein